jgi:hypothetical protein
MKRGTNLSSFSKASASDGLAQTSLRTSTRPSLSHEKPQGRVRPRQQLVVQCKRKVDLSPTGAGGLVLVASVARTAFATCGHFKFGLPFLELSLDEKKNVDENLQFQ